MVADIVYTMVAEVNIAVIVILGISFFQRGLFFPFMKVKVSGGKKILVRVLHPVQSYFSVGEIDEGFLVFKDRKKETRRLVFVPGCIDRAATIFWTSVDDEKNCMIKRMEGEAVDGHDAVKYDNLFVRALYKPNVMNEILIKIALVLIAVALVVLIVVAVVSVKNMSISQQILETLTAPAKATVTGVVG